MKNFIEKNHFEILSDENEKLLKKEMSSVNDLEK
jgi:hypothetical protein